MENIICNVCDRPESLATSIDVAQVPCCIRQFKEKSFTVWRCRNCGSLHSKEDVDLPLYYSHYPFRQQQLDFHSRLGYANRLKMLKARGARAEHTILDYGCGAGLYLQFLKENGFNNVFGYDAFIEQYSDANILETKFDIVTSYDVVEHVDDPRETISVLAELVNLGGLFILGTPNADHISLKKRPFEIELSQPYHRHILSERALTKIACDNGLEFVHVYRRFYFDTLVPRVNTRFMWDYIAATGGHLDICVEPIQNTLIYSSPKLLASSLLGYFYPPRGNILLTYRKLHQVAPTARMKNKKAK